MQNITNTSIQERLQVLHDYIQRTIDALNDLSSGTRQVAQNLGVNIGRTDIPATTGISHTTMMTPNVGYGFVQVPGGFVQAIVPQTGFPMVNPFVTGLSHTSQLNQLVPQLNQGVQQLPVNVPQYNIVQTPYGLMQIPVTNNWMGQNVGGLSHSQFVPNQGWVNVQGWVNPLQNWINPMLTNVGGLSHSPVVPNTMIPQTQGFVGQPVVGQPIVGQQILGQPVVGQQNLAQPVVLGTTM